MKINHSQELAQRVQEHLDKNHMKYMFDEDADCFHFPIYAAFSPFFFTMFSLHAEDDCILLDAEFPLIIDPPHRAPVKAFISDLNSTMKNGCYHLSSKSGRLRFHIYIDCVERIPTDAVLSRALACACAMMDLHCKDLLRLLADASEPKKPAPSTPDSFLADGFLEELLRSIHPTEESKDSSEEDGSADKPFHFPFAVKPDEEDAGEPSAAPELSEEEQQLLEKLLHISEEPDSADEDKDENED